MIKEREQARQNYKHACESDKERLHTIYRIARNKVIAKIRRDERMATINFIKQSGKPSDFWKAAKQITEPNSAQNMELMEQGVLIKDEKKIADIICTFFKTKIEWPMPWSTT